MRPVLMGDVIAAARVLLGVRGGARAGLARRLLEEAHTADLYRKRTARAHPGFGNGSLMAAAAARAQPPEPWLEDADYLRCLSTVLAALAERADGAGIRPCALCGGSAYASSRAHHAAAENRDGTAAGKSGKFRPGLEPDPRGGRAGGA